MGGNKSRPMIRVQSANEVLSRRAAAGPPRGVLGPQKPPKPILTEYNEELHNEMSKVLKVKTVTVSVS